MESDYSTSLFNRLIVVHNQEMYDLTAEYASNNWKISAVDNPARDHDRFRQRRICLQI